MLLIQMFWGVFLLTARPTTAGAHCMPSATNPTIMFRFIAKMLFKLTGWTFRLAPGVDTSRCVVTAAPHTSNWDLLYTIAAFKLLGVPMRFTIKHDWMVFPFKPFLSFFGAIGIDRSPKVAGQERRSMVEAMADLFEGRDRIAVVVTPEGSRSLRTEWKTGFYYVAQTAGVPICLGYLDFAKREAGIGMSLMPSGDVDADMRRIMAFYRNIAPKFPEKFSLDHRYA
jgi:1-acyl-sn-glycerol-3-phosphate acyltransferase